MNALRLLLCTLLLTTAASAQQIINPSTVAPPLGSYSHLGIVPAGSDMRFVAGQVGNAPDGSIADSVEAQFEAALRNVVAILASQGALPRNLVKLNVYLVKPLARDRGAAIRTAVLGDALPPSTLIYVVRLARPELMVEIDAVAVRPKPSPGSSHTRAGRGQQPQPRALRHSRALRNDPGVAIGVGAPAAR